MSDNPLIATANGSGPSAFGGAPLLQDGADIADAIRSGDWIEGGMAAFSTISDGIGAVTDPLGTLIAHGIGWALDHIEPLRGWLQDLTGNAAEVQAFAQTWANVSTQLDQVGRDLQHRLSDLDEMSGETVDAYRLYVRDLADTVASTGTWSGAVGSGLETASGLVQAVYELVRDGLAQVVATAIAAAITVVATLGLGLPIAIAQVVRRVATVAARVGQVIHRLLTSLRKLTPLFDELCTVLGKIFPIRNPHARGAHTPEGIELTTLRSAPTPDGPVTGTSSAVPLRRSPRLRNSAAPTPDGPPTGTSSTEPSLRRSERIANLTKPAPTRATVGEASRVGYRKTFLEANPDINPKDVVVHHAIEQQALQYYKGSITRSQMNSIENLRGIPQSLNNTLHLRDIRNAWDDFYLSHPTATLDELLDYATELDDKFGHLFTPPIR